MVILVGIEGLTGDANNPATGYTGSFIHKLVTNWPDQQWAKYVAGPGVVSDVVGTGTIAYRKGAARSELKQEGVSRNDRRMRS